MIALARIGKLFRRMTRLERDELRTRSLFAERFERFASPRQRKLVERTFTYS